MNKILEVKNLKKKFGKKEVLKDINLDINEGDILAFIGPNGSGKTTTIKLILGMNKIDDGNVFINGFDVKKDFVKAIETVGCIVENPDFYMYLTGKQNLLLTKNLYPKVTEADLNNTIKLVGLENRINDKVSKYSLGMRQRLGIARAIMTNPNLLILDEPTNGLDPEGIKDLRDLLKKLAKEKKMGILISSHNLSELESFCNKVSIINKGITLETNEVNHLKEKDIEKYIFEVDKINKAKKLLENIEEIEENKFIIEIHKKEIPNIIKELINNDILIFEVKKDTQTLEEAYLSKTGGNKID